MSEQDASKTKEDKKDQDFITVEGVLDLDAKHAGRLVHPDNHGKYKHSDPFIPKELVKRFKLKKGMYVVGHAAKKDKFKNPKVHYIKTVDGLGLDERRRCMSFQNATTIPPEDQLTLETKDGRMTNRVIDLFTPIGKGQRALIVAPPRTGKTTLLHDIAAGIKENHPECHLMVLLVDERPEEVTDFKRSVDAEIFASSNDEELRQHIKTAELAIERARSLTEAGKDVVVLIDSLTRLSRAYNSAKGGSGRTLSGGLDARALEKPRHMFSSARNTEELGSLTIIASALIDTGSRMDDFIFQEFKGTGNMELVLDRKVADLRLWPAINLAESGTRREELLLEEDTLDRVSFFRRALAPLKVIECAETLLARMGKTKTNKEFLKLLSR